MPQTEFTHVAIIYNPNSTGTSKVNAEALAAKLRPALKGRKIEVSLQPTAHAGHAVTLARDIALRWGHPLIISASGDGGYHEVVNGAMQAQAKGADPICAVLPSGNANDHRSATRRQPLSKAIIAGSVTRIDLLAARIRTPDSGEVTRYAHSYIGLGLTPVVAAELNRHSLSRLKEARIVLAAFWKFRPFKILIKGKEKSFDSVVLSNINRMAKVLTLNDTGETDDGKFEVALFPHTSKLFLLGKLIKAAAYRIEPHEQTDHYAFTTLKPLPMQLDGEVLTIDAGSEVEVTAARRSLWTVL